MLWTWIYFPRALSFFSCSVLQQSHDPGSGTISNQFHDGSASKRYEIQIIKWDSDPYLRVKLAFIVGFRYFCLWSLRKVKCFKKINRKKLHKARDEGKLRPNSGDPRSLVSSTPRPCRLSRTGRGTAQRHGTATALCEVMSWGFELCWYLFFFFFCFCFYYQVLPPQLLSLTATLLLRPLQWLCFREKQDL